MVAVPKTLLYDLITALSAGDRNSDEEPRARYRSLLPRICSFLAARQASQKVALHFDQPGRLSVELFDLLRSAELLLHSFSDARIAVPERCCFVRLSNRAALARVRCRQASRSGIHWSLRCMHCCSTSRHSATAMERLLAACQPCVPCCARLPRAPHT